MSRTSKNAIFNQNLAVVVQKRYYIRLQAVYLKALLDYCLKVLLEFAQ